MTAHQLLRLKQVEVKTGLKRSQIYLYMKEGTVIPPFLTGQISRIR